MKVLSIYQFTFWKSKYNLVVNLFWFNKIPFSTMYDYPMTNRLTDNMLVKTTMNL